MAQGITSFEVSTNQAEAQRMQGQGYLKLGVVLNTDGLGNAVNLWYKSEEGAKPITKVQVSFSDEMMRGLTRAGYIQVNKSLRPGCSIFLWYFSGSTSYDTPITEVAVTTDPYQEAPKMKLGWERVGCDLRGDKSVYIWVKRAEDTYVCDVAATNSHTNDSDWFGEGYIRIDESTNTNWCGVSTTNFLWYRQSTDPASAITDLQVSTNQKEYMQYQQQGYELLNTNLNEQGGGSPVFLWNKKEKTTPVQSILLLLVESAKTTFQKNGIEVLPGNINNGNSGYPRYLCVLYKQ